MIEATVALALLALMMGVVAPNMARWYSGVALRVSMSEAHQAVSALQSQAVFRVRDFALIEELRPGTPTAKRLPKGWALELSERQPNLAMFWRNGSCTPGLAWLSNGRERLRVEVRNALCELDVTIAPIEASA